MLTKDLCTGLGDLALVFQAPEESHLLFFLSSSGVTLQSLLYSFISQHSLDIILIFLQVHNKLYLALVHRPLILGQILFG